MGETLYTSVEGPKGTADIFEVTQEIESDRLRNESMGSSRPWDVKYEVRFGSEVQAFWAEGEAVTVAKQLTGVSD